MGYQKLLSKKTLLFSQIAIAIALFLPVIIASNRLNPSQTIATGRDFINYWSGGKLALNGQADLLFSGQSYYEWLKLEFGQKLSYHNWSYPPNTLLFLWPLGFMSYLQAYFVWVMAGIVAFYSALRKLIDENIDIFIILLAPASLINMSTGQNGFFTAALIIGAFAIIDRRPILAGILIGLLTFKPQLGILIPFILILNKQWKTFIIATITTIFLFAISALFFGIDNWVIFISEIIPQQTEILKNMKGIFNFMVPSFFMAAKNAGISENLSMMIQSIISVIAFIALIWGFIKPRNKNLQLALFCISTLLFSPYIVNYDMVMLTPAVYLYYRYVREHNITNNSHYILAGLMAILPYTGFLAAQYGIPLYQILMIVFLGIIIKLLAQDNQNQINTAQISQAN